MPPIKARLLPSVAVLLLQWQMAQAGDPFRRSIEADRATGQSAAVVVEGRPLIHTAQFFPLDDRGQVIAPGRLRVQLDSVFDRLEKTLAAAVESSDRAGGLRRLVKLNIYLSDDNSLPDVRKGLAEKFEGIDGPAVAFVSGKLTRPGALIALDAVVADDEAAKPRQADRPKPHWAWPACAPFAVAPPGRLVYISGQAEPGPTLAEATRKTLDGLTKTLEHLGLEWRDVVQVKSFLGPISEVESAEREILEHFAPRAAPPLSFVEWSSSLPIEIELVVGGGAPPNDPTEPIEYLTPPWMTASPVFCRMTRVNVPTLIYVSGLYGNEGSDPQAEAASVFDSLAAILERGGSDLRHLAKATYYVSSEAASAKLNEVRPGVYDPHRPPAASKALVSGTGRAGKALTLDMIAVPRPKAPRAADSEGSNGRDQEREN